MKFYLALLALVGIAESNGCALTLGSLGNKLNLQDLKRAQNAGRGVGPAQGASGTKFACFPVATQAAQVRQAPIPPAKVTITITPHHSAVQAAQPTYSSVQSSFFPTVDFYPWANNVPQFTSQPVTSAPVTPTTTYATNLPTQTLTTAPITVNQEVTETQIQPLAVQPVVIEHTPQVPVIQTFEPIIVPTQVQPTVLPIQIQQPVDTTQVIPTIDFDPFIYSQDTGDQNLNLTTQPRPLITATYDNLETPALEIYPNTFESAVTPDVGTTDFGTTDFNNFDFSTFNNDVAVADVVPAIEPTGTTQIPQFNYDDFDFSSLNLDDLFAASPAE